MKLSEIKGEHALEVIADLIDPISKLLKDEKFKKKIQGGNKLDAIKYLLKNHPKNVIEIFAIINDKDPETYAPNLIELPMMLMDLINDPDVMSLFGSQDQNTQLASSGPATGNTEAREK